MQGGQSLPIVSDLAAASVSLRHNASVQFGKSIVTTTTYEGVPILQTSCRSRLLAVRGVSLTSALIHSTN